MMFLFDAGQGLKDTVWLGSSSNSGGIQTPFDQVDYSPCKICLFFFFIKFESVLYTLDSTLIVRITM